MFYTKPTKETKIGWAVLMFGLLFALQAFGQSPHFRIQNGLLLNNLDGNQQAITNLAKVDSATYYINGIPFQVGGTNITVVIITSNTITTNLTVISNGVANTLTVTSNLTLPYIPAPSVVVVGAGGVAGVPFTGTNGAFLNGAGGFGAFGSQFQTLSDGKTSLTPGYTSTNPAVSGSTQYLPSASNVADDGTNNMAIWDPITGDLRVGFSKGATNGSVHAGTFYGAVKVAGSLSAFPGANLQIGDIGRSNAVNFVQATNFVLTNAVGAVTNKLINGVDWFINSIQTLGFIFSEDGVTPNADLGFANWFPPVESTAVSGTLTPNFQFAEADYSASTGFLIGPGINFVVGAYDHTTCKVTNTSGSPFAVTVLYQANVHTNWQGGVCMVTNNAFFDVESNASGMWIYWRPGDNTGMSGLPPGVITNGQVAPWSSPGAITTPTLFGNVVGVVFPTNIWGSITTASNLTTLQCVDGAGGTSGLAINRTNWNIDFLTNAYFICPTNALGICISNLYNLTVGALNKTEVYLYVTNWGSANAVTSPISFAGNANPPGLHGISQGMYLNQGQTAASSASSTNWYRLHCEIFATNTTMPAWQASWYLDAPVATPVLFTSQPSSTAAIPSNLRAQGVLNITSEGASSSGVIHLNAAGTVFDVEYNIAQITGAKHIYLDNFLINNGTSYGCYSGDIPQGPMFGGLYNNLTNLGTLVSSNFVGGGLGLTNLPQTFFGGLSAAQALGTTMGILPLGFPVAAHLAAAQEGNYAYLFTNVFAVYSLTGTTNKGLGPGSNYSVTLRNGSSVGAMANSTITIFFGATGPTNWYAPGGVPVLFTNQYLDFGDVISGTGSVSEWSNYKLN